MDADHSSSQSEPAFDTFQAHQQDSSAIFNYTFDKRTEITGHASVKLFIQCTHFPDVDLFVALQKVGADGQEVKFYHSTQQIEASAAFGWLRASHRELDSVKSTPERPYHIHRVRQWLRPCDIVEVQIELWPSSTLWEAGETMRLVVKGNSFTNTENPTQFKGPSHSFGEVKVWSGGSYASKLLVPFVE